jgi:hypothetical protein
MCKDAKYHKVKYIGHFDIPLTKIHEQEGKSEEIIEKTI